MMQGKGDIAVFYWSVTCVSNKGELEAFVPVRLYLQLCCASGKDSVGVVLMTVRST
jgi:hypothetical protein